MLPLPAPREHLQKHTAKPSSQLEFEFNPDQNQTQHQHSGCRGDSDFPEQTRRTRRVPDVVDVHAENGGDGVQRQENHRDGGKDVDRLGVVFVRDADVVGHERLGFFGVFVEGGEVLDHVGEEGLRAFIHAGVELGFRCFAELQRAVDHFLLLLVDGGDDVEFFPEEPDFFVHLGAGFSDCAFVADRGPAAVDVLQIAVR